MTLPSPRLVIILALSLLAVLLVAFLPIAAWAQGVRDWVDGFGAWGPWLLIAIMAPWGMFIPTVPLQFVAAGLYGIGPGIAIAYAGVSLAMCLILALGRGFLRRPIQRLIARQRTLRHLDTAIALEGWRAVALIRLSSVAPAHLVNWVLSVSSLPISTIVIVTLLAKAPGVILFAVLGHAGLGGAEARAHPMTWVLVGVGLIATVAVVIIVRRRTQALMAAAQLETVDADPHTKDGDPAVASV